MNLTAIAALLSLPLTGAPVLIAFLNGRSSWRRLERVTALAGKVTPGSPEADALRRLQLRLIALIQFRTFMSRKRRIVLLGAVFALIADLIGTAGAITIMIASAFDSKALTRLGYAVLGMGVGALIGAIAATVLVLVGLVRIEKFRAERRDRRSNLAAPAATTASGVNSRSRLAFRASREPQLRGRRRRGRA